MTPERIVELTLLFKRSAKHHNTLYETELESLGRECLNEIERLTTENARLEHQMEIDEMQFGDEVKRLEAENVELRKDAETARTLYYQEAEAHKRYKEWHHEDQAKLAARPTPSSALTKALEDTCALTREEIEKLQHQALSDGEIFDRRERVQIDVDQESFLKLCDMALRASPGGEDIEQEDSDALALCNKLMEKCHESPLFEIAVRHTIIRLLQQRTECIEKGRMEGFKYGCEMSGTWPESEKDQQDVCFVAKTQMSAAIVASHKSPAPEKEGRHD